MLKGLRHEDFAVLGQFCAKIITYCLYSYTKCSFNTIIIFLVVFENMASKLEKIGPIFSSFNPFPLLPSVATGDRKQFQWRKIVSDNKARSLFLEFS